MAFTGKATYTAGAALPEAAEDVSDLVAINSPHETPLLDALGDAARSAHATVHEWLEDALLPNTDAINDSTWTNPTTDTQFTVAHADRFRVGDQIKALEASEVMLVTAVNTGTNTLTVVRGYGGSVLNSLADHLPLTIIGNAALEGDDAAAARFTARSRRTNYTQIFTATVEVSGSELAVRQVGVRDELDYQKVQRTRELLRDLESSVINGRAPAATPEGSATVRRSMRGIRSFLSTNIFAPGVGGFPVDPQLTEEQLNLALRTIWESSNGRVDRGGRRREAVHQPVHRAGRAHVRGRGPDLPRRRAGVRERLRRVPRRPQPRRHRRHRAAAGLQPHRGDAPGRPQLLLQAPRRRRRPQQRSAHRRVHAGAAQRERARCDSGIGVIESGSGFRGPGSGWRQLRCSLSPGTRDPEPGTRLFWSSQ